MAELNHYDVLVIGGGHAGVEAAWAAANILQPVGGQVALVTMDAEKIAAMSCNPAIGGLAKGQMVREVDALGGLMGMAADATGIQFRMLNASKGPAVHGPRCQSDKYRYAREVQRYLKTRANLHIVLCFSPVGAIFRVRARKFPALVNCTVTDWLRKHTYGRSSRKSRSYRLPAKARGCR